VLEVLKQNVGLGKKNTQRAKRPTHKIEPGKRITSEVPTISGSSASAGPSSAATSSSTTTNPSKKRKLTFVNDKVWYCCRCGGKWKKSSEHRWICCDECDKTFHLQCSGYDYPEEDYYDVDINTIQFKCCE